MVVASRLKQRGIRTLVVESGPERAGAEPNPLNEVVLEGQPYRACIEGRHRELGGTSVLWGGAMLPFLPCDVGPHTAGWHLDWPITFEDLACEFAEIEQIFRLPAGTYDVASIPRRYNQSFILRSAKWPPFSMRNIAHVLGSTIRGPGLDVWVDATVSRFRLSEYGHVCNVTAVGPSGAELDIEADEVVIAAGAIESTRLLLLLDAQHHNRVFEPEDLLGCYLFDHLSITAAEIVPINVTALNEIFGVSFDDGGMRDLRIEPSTVLRTTNRMPGAFAHITALSPTDSGFTALRAVFRDLQRNSSLPWRKIGALNRDLGWLARAAWWRYVKQRLLYPRHSKFELMAVIEQMPSERNRITLAREKQDAFGNPMTKIVWRANEEDHDTFRNLQKALCVWWGQSSFAKLARLQETPEHLWRERLNSGSDIYHPGGTTRMGRSPSTGIVDANLRTFRVRNLHVVSTSTFPSGGSSNPTFMLIAVALRFARHLAAQLAS